MDSADKPRAPKPPKDRHPALKGTAVGVWCPEAVGKVPGYPRTAEAFEARCGQLRVNSTRARARGRLTRLGVPNGYAGRRVEASEIRRNSRNAAEWLMEDGPFRGLADCREARIAFTAALAIILDTTLPNPPPPRDDPDLHGVHRPEAGGTPRRGECRGAVGVPTAVDGAGEGRSGGRGGPGDQSERIMLRRNGVSLEEKNGLSDPVRSR